MAAEQFDYNKAYDNITSHGWLTYSEGKLLVRYVNKTKGPIVEVGSYQGRSAMLLGQLCCETNREVHCIDPWEDGFSDELTGEMVFQRFLENTAGLNVVPVRQCVENWIPFPCEFVYLDGDHTEEGTRAQIEKALQCEPKYIAIHDVNDRGDGAKIKRVAVELLGDWVERVERLAIWRMRSV